MELRLFFTQLPSEAMLIALDRRLSSLAGNQEALDNGKRLWITHVPETASRPFLHAKPFDMFVHPVRFSASQAEEFRVGLGCVPKRCMFCCSPDDSSDAQEVLFAIVMEVMALCPALMAIDERLGRTMFHVDERELEFSSQYLDEFPGGVYEVAHEKENGELGVEWLVNSVWLGAWRSKSFRHCRQSADHSRFSSLDYL